MLTIKHQSLSIIIIFTVNVCFSQTNDTLRYHEPVKFHYPETTTVTVLPNDTSYFCIALKKNETSIKFKGVWRRLGTNKQLDKFIYDNKPHIDTDKILIVAPANTPYSDFKFVIDIFKKYDILTFHLASKD